MITKYLNPVLGDLEGGFKETGVILWSDILISLNLEGGKTRG